MNIIPQRWLVLHTRSKKHEQEKKSKDLPTRNDPQMENKQQETFKCGCHALLQRQKRFCTTIDQTDHSIEHAARGGHH
jgi:hypothetical protein